MNGGFIQYYDNNYGIFAIETLDALQEIKGFNTLRLLKPSIDIIQSYNKDNISFKDYMIKNGYANNGDIENMPDKLDNEYYRLENKEDLEKLLADYLRKNKDKIK